MNETKTKKCAGTVVLAAVSVILTVVALLLVVVNLFSEYYDELIYAHIATIVIALVTLFYTTVGYKIPHGNYIRYAFVIFAAVLALDLLLIYANMEKLPFALLLVSIIVVSYMAGRLKHRTLVTVCSVIALILMLVPVVMALAGSSAGLEGAISVNIAQCAIFVALVIGYFARYTEHKEAGKAE